MFNISAILTIYCMLYIKHKIHYITHGRFLDPVSTSFSCLSILELWLGLMRKLDKPDEDLEKLVTGSYLQTCTVERQDRENTKKTCKLTHHPRKRKGLSARFSHELGCNLE